VLTGLDGAVIEETIDQGRAMTISDGLKRTDLVLDSDDETEVSLRN
jgi:hypothetical protein